MIQRVRIKNFRCLRDVELELSPLTLLVGPNASGKSSILKALGSLTLSSSDRWQHSASPGLELQLAGGNHYSAGEKEWNRKRPYEARLLHLDVQKLRASNQVERQHRLADDGSNLVNVFASLTRKEKERLAQELAARVPVISDVDHRPEAQVGWHRLVFQDRWAPSVWYEPQEISDGTILMLAFLLLQYEQPPVDLLAVEEPERGLHPYLLGELLSFMRELSTGEIGSRPIQILLATHSAELLEFARPEEVRFLTRRGEDIVVEKAPIDSPDWKASLREYRESLGSVWLSGGLGGVPGGH